MTGTLEELHELRCKSGVLAGEQTEGVTLGASSPCSADSVDVILSRLGEIVVDDTLDILHVYFICVR